MTYGLGPVPVAALGTLTAVGSGIMHDVLAHDAPSVLQAGSKLYGLSAVLGSAIVVIIPHLPINSSLAAGLTAVFVFALRLLALRYDWRAPRPWHTTGKR